MRQVRVSVNDLQEILMRNRKEHREIFLQAQAKYREAVISALDEQLKLARDGKPFVLRSLVAMVAPQDHTRDYDRAIEMLKMSTDAQVVLTEDEFQCYVQDIWAWSRSWAHSNSSYVASNPKLQSLMEENE